MGNVVKDYEHPEQVWKDVYHNKLVELEQYEKEIEKYMFARQFFFINNFESTREDNLKYVREYLKNI